jgi:hypothetical protein
MLPVQGSFEKCYITICNFYIICLQPVNRICRAIYCGKDLCNESAALLSTVLLLKRFFYSVYMLFYVAYCVSVVISKCISLMYFISEFFVLDI